MPAYDPDCKLSYPGVLIMATPSSLLIYLDTNYATKIPGNNHNTMNNTKHLKMVTFAMRMDMQRGVE